MITIEEDIDDWKNPWQNPNVDVGILPATQITAIERFVLRHALETARSTWITQELIRAQQRPVEGLWNPTSTYLLVLDNLEQRLFPLRPSAPQVQP
jgi:hypothetical protein